jgi:hypothetical protein
MHRIFLLSPAFAGGKRAEMLFNPRAGFDLAKALQRGEQRSLGEIFSFLSGLYFRGKLAYAKAFQRPPKAHPGALVITPTRGLVDVDQSVGLDDLREFGTVPIEETDLRYTEPLKRDARALATKRGCEVVLLGSISTGKYVNALLECLGDQLLFPTEFVGRGDMSRGGLLLRHVRDGKELTYSRVAGAVRRGTRPPKLAPVSWKGTAWDLRAADAKSL